MTARHTSGTRRRWQLAAPGRANLSFGTGELPVPGDREIVVSASAVSLNARGPFGKVVVSVEGGA